MLYKEAKEYMREHAKEILQRDRSGKGWICPICRSGSGRNGTGLTTPDGGTHFSCWRGCFTNADIFDIVGLASNTDDFKQQVLATADLFGIQIEDQNTFKIEQNGRSTVHNTQYTTQKEEPEDYSAFFLQAHANLDKTDYHRGLSKETLDRFQVGYVDSWRHPKAPKAPLSPRLIIPTSKSSYLARDTRSDLTDQQKEYSKSKVGKMHIFNAEALQTATQPIVVVEGEIDAMSVVEVGGEAVALGSTNNWRKLIKLVEQTSPVQPLILSLDNDAAGSKTTKDLSAALEKLNIPYVVADVAAPYKDANEALVSDREAFSASVAQAESLQPKDKAEEEREALLRESALYGLADFLRDVKNSKDNECLPTGFASLDKVLDGGLYPGLYCIGAISSLGKTTFCLQIADYIAASGADVVIFSLEMGRDELIAKSLSRLSMSASIESCGNTTFAKTTRGIMTYSRYASYSQEEMDVLRSSIVAYQEYAGHIYIVEGMGNVGVDQIRAEVERHKRITGRAPVVLCDYLQILAPMDPRYSDKQNTDKAVVELKRMSRDFKIPVIGISSFNRDNYTSPVNLAAFKESGAIEYGSDVLIGLQYDGMDYRDGETDKERDRRVRTLMKDVVEKGKNGQAQAIQVKVLKQRNGSKGDAYLRFYPMFNCFESADGPTDEDGWTTVASAEQPPKVKKRDVERDQLRRAFIWARDDDGKASLGAMADQLDKSKAKVKNLIKEYGGYVVDGDMVSVEPPPEPVQFFDLGEQEEIPFEWTTE